MWSYWKMLKKENIMSRFVIETTLWLKVQNAPRTDAEEGRCSAASRTQKWVYSGLNLSGALIKNLPANARDPRDAGSIPGSGRFPREGNINPLQYSCLGNPMHRGAWRATVRGVTKSWTRQSTHMAWRLEYWQWGCMWWSGTVLKIKMKGILISCKSDKPGWKPGSPPPPLDNCKNDGFIY